VDQPLTLNVEVRSQSAGFFFWARLNITAPDILAFSTSGPFAPTTSRRLPDGTKSDSRIASRERAPRWGRAAENLEDCRLSRGLYRFLPQTFSASGSGNLSKDCAGILPEMRAASSAARSA